MGCIDRLNKQSPTLRIGSIIAVNDLVYDTGLTFPQAVEKYRSVGGKITDEEAKKASCDIENSFNHIPKGHLEGEVCYGLTARFPDRRKIVKRLELDGLIKITEKGIVSNIEI